MKVIKGTTKELIKWGIKEKDEMSIEEIKERLVDYKMEVLKLASRQAVSDIELLLASLEKEKEGSDYFRLEVNKYTDELGKEKERVIFWVESYDEELAHSKQAEERIKQLGKTIDEWTRLYSDLSKIRERLIEKVKELDDRILELVLKIDEYAGRIIEGELRLKNLTGEIKSWDIPQYYKNKVLEEAKDDLKDYTSPNLLVEQLTERVKELEAELRKGPCCNLICHAEKLQLETTLASIKADKSIGKLEVVGSFGEDD